MVCQHHRPRRPLRILAPLRSCKEAKVSRAGGPTFNRLVFLTRPQTFQSFQKFPTLGDYYICFGHLQLSTTNHPHGFLVPIIPGWLWVVDPIDGTTNFASGQPMSAVSIAAAKDGQLRVGVRYPR